MDVTLDHRILKDPEQLLNEEKVKEERRKEEREEEERKREKKKKKEEVELEELDEWYGIHRISIKTMPTSTTPSI